MFCSLMTSDIGDIRPSGVEWRTLPVPVPKLDMCDAAHSTEEASVDPALRVLSDTEFTELSAEISQLEFRSEASLCLYGGCEAPAVPQMSASLEVSLQQHAHREALPGVVSESLRVPRAATPLMHASARGMDRSGSSEAPRLQWSPDLRCR